MTFSPYLFKTRLYTDSLATALWSLATLKRNQHYPEVVNNHNLIANLLRQDTTSKTIVFSFFFYILLPSFLRLVERKHAKIQI